MKRALVLALAILALPGVVFAQAEDRRRAPTSASASADPCGNVTGDRTRGPEAASPGYDPRVPTPAGATSFTGIAPPGRDPSRGFPQPLQPDQAYDACRQQLNR